MHIPSDPQVRSDAPGVVGKSAEIVSPATYAVPEASTAIPAAVSQPCAPPRKVAYSRVVPPGPSFATNASEHRPKASQPPLYVGSAADGVAGKSTESAYPATYTLPSPPTAIARGYPAPTYV